MIEFVSYQEKYLDFVYNTECECFSKPWSKQAIKDENSDINSVFIIAVSDNFPCAYVSCKVPVDIAYINNIAVTKEFRNKRIAYELLKELEKRVIDKGAIEITLEVRKSNLSAIGLYEKSGYSVVGERKDFYSHPTENGIIYTKKLI